MTVQILQRALPIALIAFMLNGCVNGATVRNSGSNSNAPTPTPTATATPSPSPSTQISTQPATPTAGSQASLVIANGTPSTSFTVVIAIGAANVNAAGATNASGAATVPFAVPAQTNGQTAQVTVTYTGGTTATGSFTIAP